MTINSGLTVNEADIIQKAAGATKIGLRVMNSATGYTDNDGLFLGIGTAGSGLFEMRSNLSMTFRTNATARFLINADGTLRFHNYTTANGLLYTDASGNLLQLAPGSNGQCLTWTGGVPVWGSCGVTGTGSSGQIAFWNGTSSQTGSDGLTWDGSYIAIESTGYSGGLNVGGGNAVSTLTDGMLAITVFGASTQIHGGSLVLANSGGTGFVNLNTTTGLTFTGDARPTKTITLSPEYPGASFTPDGSSTTDGAMLSDNTGSGGAWRNFYEWTSTQATLQDYTIAVRVTLPADFDAWDTNAVSLEYQTGVASTASNAISMSITESTQSTPACNLSTDRASTTWTTTNMVCSGAVLNNGSNDWDTAGQSAIIRIKVKANSTASAFARVGDIKLTYRAKF